jgi:hypothetical protein
MKVDVSRAASCTEEDFEEELVTPSTCESILDKLLVGAAADSGAVEGADGGVEIGDVHDWEESFNELFPDLI